MQRLILTPLSLLILLCAGVPACMAGESTPPPLPPMRLLVLANYNMPLAQISGSTLQAGLLKDLGERIASEAKMTPSFVILPRNRIADALRNNEADLICDTMPEWLLGAPPLHWSAPVVWNPQYLASAAPHPAPERWSQLQGRMIITMLGYHYPKPTELAQGFADGSWTRSDALSEEAMLRRLQLGRGDYGIIGALPLNWFLKNHPEAHFNLGIPVVNEPTRCGLTQQANFPSTRVLQAIKRLSDDGSLQRLTSAYAR